MEQAVQPLDAEEIVDIPVISLAEDYKAEALRLRNKLLLYRFRTFGKKAIAGRFIDATIEPRLNQIFAPLISVAGTEELRAELRAVARELNAELIEDRGLDVEADILAIIQTLFAAPASRTSRTGARASVFV